MIFVEDLVVRFASGGRTLTAVDRVSLHVARGQTLGLVGESGCGKTTLARAIVGLAPVASGDVRVDGQRPRGGRPAPGVQLVFQNPAAALSPRMTVGAAIEEAIVCQRAVARPARRAEVAALLDQVGLPASAAERYPHQLSGGQLQRVCIARALAAKPAVLLLDEVTASLDVSVQARVLNLLRELQRELGLTLLYISHDLSVVRHLADEVAVMYLGRVVESGPAAELFAAPRHPYTRALVAAVPRLADAGQLPPAALSGEPPDPTAVPSGCAFHPRCPHARTLKAVGCDRCTAMRPALEAGAGRSVACHFPLGAEPELTTREISS